MATPLPPLSIVVGIDEMSRYCYRTKVDDVVEALDLLVARFEDVWLSKRAGAFRGNWSRGLQSCDQLILGTDLVVHDELITVLQTSGP